MTAAAMPPPTAMLAAASDEVVSRANRARIDFDENISSPLNIADCRKSNQALCREGADRHVAPHGDANAKSAGSRPCHG
jgi:hypothetical protein